MKTHTAIIGADGQRKITSTTEQLRIPASEILPGDWLLKPHRRGMEKDRLVSDAPVAVGNGVLMIGIVSRNALMIDDGVMVDVERTT